MNEQPTITPFRRSHAVPTPPVSWATTLSFFAAGLWSLAFAWFVPFPAWLMNTLLLIGFATIFIGFIAAGVEIDAWRKTRRRG